MLEIITIPVTPFAQNCRILIDSASNSAVVVDPGGDAAVLRRELENRKATFEAVWLTHSHLDHCGGVAELLEWKKVPLFAHADEGYMRSHVSEIAEMYGLPASEMRDCPEPDQALSGGDVVRVGGIEFDVIFTPGHSPGHVCFYYRPEGALIAGDTLFDGSIGRTDLPGGNHEQLLESIRREIYSLPDETRVMPGHGPDTSVGKEKRTNPFVRGQ